MNWKTTLRACGASTLAAAIALSAFAAPVSAQDDGGEPAEARAEARQQRLEQRAQRSSAQAGRESQRAQRQVRQEREYQAPRAHERGSREWNRGDRRSDTGAERQGREWNRRDNTNNDWGQARAAQAQRAQAEAQAQARAQAQVRADAQAARRSSGQRYERNRTYGDAARNRTYRDGYRDGRTADNRQDRWQNRDAYRSGYRDGTRTEHYRDGRRYDGQRYDTRRGDHRRWSHDWRRDNRYNWYSYRNSNRNLYRIGRYYSPYSNYRYSRVGIGFRLNSLFFGSRYWINDPWQYRLPEAHGPYRWVRYYDDALLVDIYSGEVVDVIHDFFW